MKQRETHPQHYTVRQLAEKMHLDDSAIKRRCIKGQFPGAFKYKGYWLIPKEVAR